MGFESLLITVTGKDRPGIISQLASILAERQVILSDVEQVVLHGQLILGFSFETADGDGAVESIAAASEKMNLAMEYQRFEMTSRLGVKPERPVPAVRYALTLIGQNLGAAELAEVSAIASDHHTNIERIVQLSEDRLKAIELQLSIPHTSEAAELKKSLLKSAMRGKFDVALQKEGLFRRSKRLIVFDMDSTLIRIEVIDELARLHGVGEQVSKITERAMAGEMDYDDSLRQRVALLKNLSEVALNDLVAGLPLNDGAEVLIRVLKRMGYRIAVISGGFSVAADALKAKLGIHHAFSNVLEIREGRLTGEVVGEIVNAKRKAELLVDIAASENILLDQVIAVGDGANDLLMLEKAGLGIAFRAKQRLRDAADTSLSSSGLNAILYLLGISERELSEVV